MHSPGITVREIPTLGGGSICEVFLDELEVPGDQLVGELDGGWTVLMGTLDHERVTSEKVGIVARVLDDLGPCVDGPAARLELARARGELEVARQHGRRACELLEQGRPASAQSSMAKLSMAMLTKRVAELALRWLGPNALLEPGPHAPGEGRPGALYRACVGSTIAGGAAEIQRRVIARTGLGCQP
jgi:alkylation response protein AidB-like acyl-CoA dehydrogenase